MAKRKRNASRKLTKRQMTEKYENKGKASKSHPTKKRGRPRKTSQIPEAASPNTTVSGPSDSPAWTFDMTEKYENKGKASKSHPTKKRGRPLKTSQIPEAASPNTTVSGPSDSPAWTFDMTEKYPTKKRGRPRKTSQIPEAASPNTTVSGPSDLPAWTFDVAPPSPIQGVHTPCTPQPLNLDAERILKSEVGLETQSNDGKPMLYLEGQGFLPSRVAANGIGDIITRYYTDPWPSWTKIPSRTRDSMFEEFWTKFSISPPDYRWAKGNFQMRSSVLMANKLLKARSTLRKPKWIEGGVWEKLCEHWKSEGFKKRSAQARINRASNYGASHTGGSISASQHRANMIKETGITPTPLELYRRLHQHKDKTWVDSRSKNLNEAFTRTLNQLTKSALVQGKPPPNVLDVWSDVARSKKGKVYGIGVESTTVRVGPCHHGSSSSMELITKQEFVELRREMEKVRKERDELQTKVSNSERLGVECTAVRGGPCHQGSSSSTELITKQEFDELRREIEEVKNERDELRTKVSNTERLIDENNALIRQIMQSINDQSMLFMQSRGKSKLG